MPRKLDQLYEPCAACGSAQPCCCADRVGPSASDRAKSRSIRKHFSTGEVATMIGCRRKTICKAIDRGELKAVKLPQSVHRRVIRSDLIEWMHAKGYPPGWLSDFESGPHSSEPMNELIKCCKAADHAISSLLAVRCGLTDEFLLGLRESIRLAVEDAELEV